VRLRLAGMASVAAAAAALGAATWFLLHARPPPLELGGYVLASPRPLPAVELVDEQGAVFRSADFAGHWSFLYFGYTYCPDVCPLTLVTLAAVKQQLATDGAATHAEYYLVSVDPRRDTPARLREYVAYFDPQMHALTGSPAALAALAEAAETVFAVPADDAGEHYLVSHSSNVVLLDPNGRVQAVLTPPHDPARLAADFTKVAARYGELR